MSRFPQLFHRLHEAVKRADRVLVLTHEKPDGDAAGSTTALIGWLLGIGKTVTAFSVDPMPVSCRFLDHAHRFTSDVSVFDAAHDLVIVLDSGGLDRTGAGEHLKRIPTRYTLACLDHHRTNAGYGDLVIIDPDASSASELVYRFLKEIGAPMDGGIATSLLVGLSTDTFSFTNAFTSVCSMEIAAELVSCGARMHEVARHIWQSHTPETLRLWGVALSHLVRHEQWDLAVTHVTLADLAPIGSDMPDGFTNFLAATVGNADAILVLRERPDGRLRGGMRSMTRDISAVATALGGGGHQKAAGFELEAPVVVGEDGCIVLPERLAAVLNEKLGKS